VVYKGSVAFSAGCAHIYITYTYFVVMSGFIPLQFDDTILECDGQTDRWTDGRMDLSQQYRALRAQHADAR